MPVAKHVDHKELSVMHVLHFVVAMSTYKSLESISYCMYCPGPGKRRISNFSGGASAPPDPPFPVGLKASKKSASGLPEKKGIPENCVFTKFD